MLFKIALKCSKLGGGGGRWTDAEHRECWSINEKVCIITYVYLSWSWWKTPCYKHHKYVVSLQYEFSCVFLTSSVGQTFSHTQHREVTFSLLVVFLDPFGQTGWEGMKLGVGRSFGSWALGRIGRVGGTFGWVWMRVVWMCTD